MFADIVGFTQLAEKIGPEGAYFAVTGALKILDGIARRHGGSVDKYLGDCVMVVFGYPVPTADSAGSAAAAALEMREQFREYRRRLDGADLLDLVVGINTGSMVAGDIRGRVIREFHVLGDAVNVRGALEGESAARRDLRRTRDTRRNAGHLRVHPARRHAPQGQDGRGEHLRARRLA
jgi:adenylate cyclase